LAYGDKLTVDNLRTTGNIGDFAEFLSYYLWLLRLDGAKGAAGNPLDALLAAGNGLPFEARVALRLEKVRALHALGQNDEAKRLLNELLSEARIFFTSRNSTLDVYFVAGVLAQEQGDVARAQELWRTGIRLFEESHEYELVDDTSYVSFLYLAMSSLTRQPRNDRAVHFFGVWIRTMADGVPLAEVLNNSALRETLVPTRTIETAVTQMFAGPDGWDLVRALAWQTIPPHDFPQWLARRQGTEILICEAFPSGLSPRAVDKRAVHWHYRRCGPGTNRGAGSCSPMDFQRL
jgi:tetratricopeptide (TPR) repeat protein